MKQFDTFTASALYCPRCQMSMQVRERLLLVLPDGDLYDFRCVGCGNSLGTRTVTNGEKSMGKVVVV
ncbi:MAG: hypothetical protein ACE5GF_02645 [Thermodesulfobacteriota bacterium]